MIQDSDDEDMSFQDHHCFGSSNNKTDYRKCNSKNDSHFTCL